MLAVGLTVAALTSGCAKKDTGTAAQTPQPVESSLPFQNTVSFVFSDVSVTTAGPTLLRLGFTMHNSSKKDSILCDASEFTVKLSDNTVVPADTSAENKCDPDSLDPGKSGTALVFFDLPSGYTGPIELSMAGNNAIVGRGRTQIK
jgi:hypothetical protein